MEIYGPALCQNCYGAFRATDNKNGDGGSNPAISISLTEGKYYVVVQASKYGKTGAFTLQCKDFTTTPPPLKLDVPFRAAFSQMWEVDWYIFEVKEKGRYVLETSGDMDTLLLLYGANVPNDFIDQDDDSGEDNNAKITRVLDPGKYHVGCRGYSNQTGEYTIVLRR